MKEKKGRSNLETCHEIFEATKNPLFSFDNQCPYLAVKKKTLKFAKGGAQERQLLIEYVVLERLNT